MNSHACHVGLVTPSCPAMAWRRRAPLRPWRKRSSMKEKIMIGARGLSRAADSNTEQGRSQAQKAQEKKSQFATFPLFCRRSVIVNSPCPLVAKRSNRSNPVKVNQTDSDAQAAGQNPCKSLNINSLQNKQLCSRQTIFNLVKRGQNNPIRHDFLLAQLAPLQPQCQALAQGTT